MTRERENSRRFHSKLDLALLATALSSTETTRLVFSQFDRADYRTRKEVLTKVRSGHSEEKAASAADI